MYPNASDRSRRVYVTKTGECRRRPGIALDEAVEAAKKIREEFGRDIVLCMSGGIDSECMARAFAEAKIPVRAAVARFMPGALNEPDIVDAFKVCEQLGIPVQVFEIDLLQFFEKEKKHLYYAEKYECRSPQLAVHMELLERVRTEMNGVPVLGGNPIEVEFSRMAGCPIFLLPSEPHMSLLRYFAHQKIAGVPFFFSYTPELIFSFWQTPQFESDLEIAHENFQLFRRGELPPLNLRQEWPFAYLGKVRKYQQGGFDIRARSSKRTGFEEARIFFRSYFLEKGKIDRDFPHEPFNYFYRKPLEELHPYPYPVGVVIPELYFPRPEFFKSGLEL